MVDESATACPTAFGQEPPPATERRGVLRVRDGVEEQAEDVLADEVPVALVYNGISHAVMMATPQDLEDFALGFSLTEALIDHLGECYGIDIEAGPAGVAVQLDIASRAFVALKERRRSLAGRTGCGLCGVDSLDQVYRTLPQVAREAVLTGQAVRAALAALPARQVLNQLTGATHAAAWCDMGGHLAVVREDVGRHNALDKVAGALARDPSLRGGDGFVLVTSRVSVEMVQKAAMAGAVGIVGVSAPTAAAVRMAAGAGLVLLAFARGDRFTCYAGEDRLAPWPWQLYLLERAGMMLERLLHKQIAAGSVSIQGFHVHAGGAHVSMRTGPVVRGGTPIELDLKPVSGKDSKRLLAMPWLPCDKALLERVVHSVGALLNPA